MMDFVGDIRLVAIIVGIIFAYAWYEIYRIRQRVRGGETAEKRSIFGIIISLLLLGLVVMFLVPWQQQNTRMNAENLNQKLEDNAERIRRLEQGEVPAN